MKYGTLAAFVLMASMVAMPALGDVSSDAVGKVLVIVQPNVKVDIAADPPGKGKLLRRPRGPRRRLSPGLCRGRAVHKGRAKEISSANRVRGTPADRERRWHGLSVQGRCPEDSHKDG